MLQQKIQTVLDTLRPMLQADGGDAVFVKFDEATGILELQLTGHCAHCPMSQITLKQGIEVEMRRQVPEVKEVMAV